MLRTFQMPPPSLQKPISYRFDADISIKSTHFRSMHLSTMFDTVKSGCSFVSISFFED